MRTLLLSLLLMASLYPDDRQEIYRLYQNKQYSAACNYGMRTFHPNRKDESFVTLYALSCLEADYIDRLAVPTSILKHSAEARANSAYFSVILMQKKMLYHSLIDKKPIPALRLPSTEHILSKVFDLYSNDSDKQERVVYQYRDKESPKKTYKLYISYNGPLGKMIIEEYYDTMLVKRHVFW